MGFGLWISGFGLKLRSRTWLADARGGPCTSPVGVPRHAHASAGARARVRALVGKSVQWAGEREKGVRLWRVRGRTGNESHTADARVSLVAKRRPGRTLSLESIGVSCCCCCLALSGRAYCCATSRCHTLRVNTRHHGRITRASAASVADLVLVIALSKGVFECRPW